MEQFILIILTFILFGCSKEPKQVYDTEIKTYRISHKEEEHHKLSNAYYIHFQTPTSTERAEVSQSNYNKYKVGDTIQVLIKYWEKPKKK